MKTSLKKLATLILAITLFTLPLKNHAQGPCTYFPVIAEPTIAVTYTKSYSDARKEASYFVTNIQYSNPSGCATINTLKTDPVVVKLSAIISLYQITSTLSADIRGIEINFGLKNDQVIFYYTLVTMSLAPSSGSYITTRIASETSTPQTYTYSADPGTFMPLNADGITEMAARKKEYVDNICIMHIPDTYTFSPMDQGDTWTQDTKSVIYSFQEIFFIAQKCFGCSVDGSLYFYNGAWPYHIPHHKKVLRNKHDIFISCEPLPGDTGKYNQIVNMAHLCPPSCDPVYNVAAYPPNPTKIIKKSKSQQTRQ